MKRSFILAMSLLLLISSGSYAGTLKPTYSLARETLGYEQIEVEVERLAVTERQFLVLMNQMDAAIDDINRLIGFGFKNMLEQKFRLVHTRDMAMPNLEYMTETLEMNQEVMRNTMYVAVRNLYTGLYSAQKGYELALDLFEIKEEAYEASLIKHKSGLISDLELKQAEMDYLEAQIDLLEAEGSYEEMTISFNTFVNADDLYTRYTLSDELVMNLNLGAEEDQIESALMNRMELKDIQNQMDLKTHEMTVYESRGNSYLIFPDIELEYKKIQIELEKLALEQERTQEAIRVEIAQDMNGLTTQANNLAVMTEMLDYQLANLEKFTLQHEMGYLSDLMYREIRNGILTFEMNYQLAVQSYNTDLFSHYHATTLGPSSEGGGF